MKMSKIKQVIVTLLKAVIVMVNVACFLVLMENVWTKFQSETTATGIRFQAQLTLSKPNI